MLWVGSVELKVLYTPGHTSDGICVLVGNQKLLTGTRCLLGSVGGLICLVVMQEVYMVVYSISF